MNYDLVLVDFADSNQWEVNHYVGHEVANLFAALATDGKAVPAQLNLPVLMHL